MQNENNLKLKAIRNDHENEIKFDGFAKFCDQKEISHNFCTARTPEHNGVTKK